MRKRYNMRVRESDLERLNKTVKNFNARLAYAQKKASFEDAIYMPSRMTPKEALASIETRDEFNRLIKKLERFNAKTSEIVTNSKGAKTTKWALNEKKREDKRIVNQNKRKMEQIEKAPPQAGGEDVGLYRALKGETRDLLRTKEIDFDNLNQKQLNKVFRTIDRIVDASKRNADLETMRDNYIKGLGQNGFLDADPELEGLIRSTDLETFFNTQQVDDTADFLFYSSPDAFDVKVEMMHAAWERASKRSK